MIKSDPLAALSGQNHGFLTRRGGVSGGVYASLNCGRASGDDLKLVNENRRRAVEMVDKRAKTLCVARQVHGREAIFVESDWPDGDAPQADALVTNQPCIALGVTTADCAPVLIVDAEAGVVAAVHAGWRGALAGIVEAAVKTMTTVGAIPNRMVAAIGPCIAQESYEVGTEFPVPFLEQDPDNSRFFEPAEDPAKSRFDLPAYVCSRAEEAGIGTVDAMRLDTYKNEELFFSYRRARRRGEDTFGLGISIISLRP
tara:strand:- start:609 stop:1376 length:768 start_codon:yes stop_codon:yes gene_type:complete